MSLRLTLSLAFAAVILLALLLAGSAFVFFRRADREQQTLEHLAAVAPQVTLELRAVQRAGAGPESVADLLRQAARANDVRVLLLDRRGIVTEDSGDNLRGSTLAQPPEVESQRGIYRSWTGRGPGGERLVFLFVPQPRFTRSPARGAGAPGSSTAGEPLDTIVLAVPEDTVAGAWRDLLPGLLAAGAIALVASLVVAALLARSIAQPLTLLTRASEEMARGRYEQEIPVRRSAEVGRLARAFNLMAREVGRSHLQMRALFANVSHDLKTPLTSILGFSQALRDGTVEGADAVVETGAIIHEEAERVRALVEDLLFLSEIDAGETPLVSAPVDLSDLLLRCGRRFAARFAARGITFTVEPSVSIVVQGDAGKLERVLDNLLDNALKYTPAGGRVELRAAAGADAAVTLFNSGAAIPAAELDRIFDRFYRLDRARSGVARGSGLGLAIARELAELHGGTLAAGSGGGGVTLTLHLPLVAAQAETGPARTPDAGPGAPPLPVRHTQSRP
jgi:signal transduction histidine kinase